jgi:Carboxypeptidase regulatory-like domain
MKMIVKRFLPAVYLALLAAALWGQGDATLTGVVTDESKALHPGAAVTATETSTGRQYSGSSDNNGVYRIVNMQPGTYRVEAQAGGFATTAVNGIELLVGQTANLPLTLKVASVQQTVEVEAEAPLLNTQTQEIGGNIDRRQMDQLPLLGRNWLDLSMLVKGVTANDVGGNRPGVARDDQFQMNLDGQ